MKSLSAVYPFCTLFLAVVTHSFASAKDAWSTGTCISAPASETMVPQKDDLDQVTNAAEDPAALYEEMKSKFLASDLCDPLKLSGDPKVKPNVFFLHHLLNARLAPLLSVDHDSQGRRVIDISRRLELVKTLLDEFQLPQRELAPIKSILESAARELEQNNKEVDDYSAGRATTITHVFTSSILKIAAIQLVQKIILQVTHKPELARDETLTELAASSIFDWDTHGKLICPFPSKDAFLKGYEGRAKLIKSGAVKNSEILTLADYTMPSNHRRLFVLNVKTGQVLTNTWLAHGAGGKLQEGPGKDGLGSSPDFSDVDGSRLSSDGFILGVKSPSGIFGERVALEGLDLNNKNISSRHIEVHGNGSPVTPSFGKISDEIYQTLLTTSNLEQTNTEAGLSSAAKLFDSLSATLTYEKVLPTTDGCLGVPPQDLPALQRVLPGNVIFSYSGKNMKSKFFKSESQ